MAQKFTRSNREAKKPKASKKPAPATPRAAPPRPQQTVVDKGQR